MTLDEFREGIEREKNRRKQDKINREAIDRENTGVLIARGRTRAIKYKMKYRRNKDG